MSCQGETDKETEAMWSEFASLFTETKDRALAEGNIEMFKFCYEFLFDHIIGPSPFSGLEKNEVAAAKEMFLEAAEQYFLRHQAQA